MALKDAIEGNGLAFAIPAFGKIPTRFYGGFKRRNMRVAFQGVR